jgi:hypothetical protein
VGMPENTPPLGMRVDQSSHPILALWSAKANSSERGDAPAGRTESRATPGTRMALYASFFSTGRCVLPFVVSIVALVLSSAGLGRPSEAVKNAIGSTVTKPNKSRWRSFGRGPRANNAAATAGHGDARAGTAALRFRGLYVSKGRGKLDT